jgi:hypothetical protein
MESPVPCGPDARAEYDERSKEVDEALEMKLCVAVSLPAQIDLKELPLQESAVTSVRHNPAANKNCYDSARLREMCCL